MKAEELFELIGEADERKIEEAHMVMQGGMMHVKNKISRKALSAIAACCALVIGVGAFALTGHKSRPDSESLHPVSTTTEPFVGVKDWEETYAPDHGEADDSDVSGKNTDDAKSSYNYSDLVDCYEPIAEDIQKTFSGETASLDISSFDESQLNECIGIYEGEIINMWVKEYLYKTVDDKFGENTIYNNRQSTVVYEMRVDKTYYGENKDGQTITVEDHLFYIEGVFAMRTGRQYVIPIYNAGNEIWHWGNVVEGSFDRESIYSTLYSFHPQIEAVGQGYIVSSDWTTLTSAEKYPIIMDTESGVEGSYYDDKMFLIPKDTFETQMNLLCDTIE